MHSPISFGEDVCLGKVDNGQNVIVITVVAHLHRTFYDVSFPCNDYFMLLWCDRGSRCREFTATAVHTASFTELGRTNIIKSQKLLPPRSSIKLVC